MGKARIVVVIAIVLSIITIITIIKTRDDRNTYINIHNDNEFIGSVIDITGSRYNS